jgi:hypothetical protein
LIEVFFGSEFLQGRLVPLDLSLKILTALLEAIEVLLLHNTEPLKERHNFSGERLRFRLQFFK